MTSYMIARYERKDVTLIHLNVFGSDVRTVSDGNFVTVCGRCLVALRESTERIWLVWIHLCSEWRRQMNLRGVVNGERCWGLIRRPELMLSNGLFRPVPVRTRTASGFLSCGLRRVRPAWDAVSKSSAQAHPAEMHSPLQVVPRAAIQKVHQSTSKRCVLLHDTYWRCMLLQETRTLHLHVKAVRFRLLYYISNFMLFL